MMNDKLEGLLEEIDEFITRAINVEATANTIEMLTGMTIEQVAEGFRDGKIDEPEVLSQEWIINNQERKGVHFFVNVTKLQNLLVPKQELPVIPEYVADWIKEEQGTMSNWKLPSRFISDSKYKKDQRRYKWSQVEGNMDKFMSALINSYEVEEEQKYYVIDKEDNILLIRGYGGIEKADNLKITNSGGGALKLTEQEIKDFDPRYWAFAKPVE